MKTLSYKIKFNNPCFMGNAEQGGQWRTPPFKALIRQWWRVSYASMKSFQIDVKQMREDEARLFGSATDESGGPSSLKSKLRIRLDSWSVGTMNRNEQVNGAQIAHQEVRGVVNSATYLGFGPVRSQKVDKSNAIKEGESTTLKIAIAGDNVDKQIAIIKNTLSLLNEFGTIGGRSRNGWGSFTLDAADPVSLPLRPWREALTLDWAHCIGRDERGPLVWTTQSKATWSEAMTELAKVKIALRTSFLFPNEQPNGSVQDRHWLAYPVTNHRVQSWGNFRLPNTLRFKVRRTATSQFVGVIFHMPCKPPPEFKPELRTLERIWGSVHTQLDNPLKVNVTRVNQ
jgi:CRISPR-associated protein Cmr1